MKIWIRRLAFTGAGLLGLILAVYLVLLSGVATGIINRVVRSKLEGLVDGEIRFGRVTTNVLTRVTVRDLLVLSRDGKTNLPVIASDRVNFDFHLWDLWLKGPEKFSDSALVSLEGVRFFLIRDIKGQWNVWKLVQPLLKKRPPSGQGVAGTAPARSFPAARIVLKDASVAVNDQSRNFTAEVKLRGELKRVASHELVFDLEGRTEESGRDNLKLTGHAWLAESRVQGELTLGEVPLPTYVNFALAGGGFRFRKGTGDLHLKLLADGGILKVTGRASLRGGVLKVPGILQPIADLNGDLDFVENGLRFAGLGGTFLGSRWTAGGQVTDLRDPRLDLFAMNPALDLGSAAAGFKGGAALEISGTASVAVSVTGKVLNPLVSGEVASDMLHLKKVAVADLRARVQIDRRKVLLQSASGRLWEGGLSAEGQLAFGGGQPPTLNLTARLKAFDLRALLLEEARGLPMDGKGDATVIFSGPLTRLEGHGESTVTGMRLADLDLGGLDLKASWKPGSADLSLEGWKGALQARALLTLGSAPEFKSSSVLLSGQDLTSLATVLAAAPFSPGVHSTIRNLRDHLKGKLDILVRAQGPIKDPALTAEFSIPEARFEGWQGKLKLREPLDLSLAGSAHLASGVLTLGAAGKPVSLVLSRHKKGLSLELSGSVSQHPLPGRGGNHLKIKARGELEALSVLELVKSSQGRLDGEIDLTGTLEKPTASGSLEIKGFKGTFTKYLGKVSEGHLLTSFREEGISVEDLSFRAGGLVQGRGKLQWVPGVIPAGDITLSTDEKGILIENWDEMARGYVAFDPQYPFYLRLREGEPAFLSGRVKAHDMTVFFAGGGPKKDVAVTMGPQRQSMGADTDIDLRLALGDNVWYSAGVDTGLPDINANLVHTGSQLLDFTKSMYTGVAFQLHLKPTTEDFMIRGPARDLRLKGGVELSGGIFSYQTNDFDIEQGAVDFKGQESDNPGSKRRGDVKVKASTLVEVATGAGDAGRRKVKITVKVNPYDSDCLAQWGMQGIFLNYQCIVFSSDPPLAQGFGESSLSEDSCQCRGGGSQAVSPQDSAIRTLLLTGVVNPAEQTGASLLLNQSFRLATHGFRKFMGKGYKSWFSRIFDIFRISPHFEYNRKEVLPGGASQQGQQELQFRDVQLQVGKNITSKMNLSLTAVRFFKTTDNSVLGQTQVDPNLSYPDIGAKLGADYSLGGNRRLVASANYKMTESLEPRPFPSEEFLKIFSSYVGVSGSINQAGYGKVTARSRKKARDTGKAGPEGK